MRVLVIGAGRVGAKVLLQLKKNPNLTVLTVDPREVPYAVEEGIIQSVDYHSELTSGGLAPVLEAVKPDMVIVTTSREDMGRSSVPGLGILVEALQEELEATSKLQIIAVDRTSVA